MHRLSWEKNESQVLMKFTIQTDESCELRQKSRSKANLMLILIDLRWKLFMNEKGHVRHFEYGS